jgi:hypothetical protein
VVGLGCVFAAGFAVDFPLCPVAASTGQPCPGCGLTRALVAALQGEFTAAYHLHPLVFLLAPILGALLLLWLLETSPRYRAISRGASQALPKLAWTSLSLCLLLLLLGVWLGRFAGYLGGPVPVESLPQWLER